MNILERNVCIDRWFEVCRFRKKSPIKRNIDTIAFFDDMRVYPLSYYLPNYVLQQLLAIKETPSLSNKHTKRFSIQNQILAPYGFRPLASGTNRRAFYYEKDPWIVLKLASDDIGMMDNKSEYFLQNILKPFCPKIFEIACDGLVALTERVETLTEKDYKKDWLEEIFDMLMSFKDRGYMFEDVGSKFFKNWGIRIRTGELVVLDFPYIYKIDESKLICRHRDFQTHEECGGLIDYNYSMGMSEICCTKCGRRYLAKSLSNERIAGESLFSDIGKEKRNMNNRTYDVQVYVTEGNKVIYDPNGSASNFVVKEKVVTATPEPKAQNKSFDVAPSVHTASQPTQAQATTPKPNAYVVNPVAGTLSTYDAVQNNPITNTDDGKPDYSVYPQLTPNPESMFAANAQSTLSADTSINTSNYGGHYFNNTPNPTEEVTPNRKYKSPTFPQYPQNPMLTRNYNAQVNREYRNTSNGQQMVTITPEEALALRAQYESKGMPMPNIITTPPNIQPGMIPNQQEPQYTKPLDTVGPIKEYEHYYQDGVRYFYWPKHIKNEMISWIKRIEEEHGADLALLVAKRLEIKFMTKKQWNARSASRTVVTDKKKEPPKVSNPTINTMARQEKVETIIAPVPPKTELKVESDSHWNNVKSASAVEMQNYGQGPIGEARPTTGLFVSKPMSQEDLDRMYARNAGPNTLMGIPGVPAVETSRLQMYLPRIKTMVEQKFNQFIMIADVEKQTFQLSYEITKFITEDIGLLYNGDSGGLLVQVNRGVDHLNKDCFIVKVTKYGSPLFDTILYPSNGPAAPQPTTLPTNTPPPVQEPVEQKEQQEKKETKAPPKPDEPRRPTISNEEITRFFARVSRKFDFSKYTRAGDAQKALRVFLAASIKQAYPEKITAPRAMNEADAYIKAAYDFEEIKPEKSSKSPTVASAL